MSIAAYEDDSNPFQTADTENSLSSSIHDSTASHDTSDHASSDLQVNDFEGQQSTSVSTLQQSPGATPLNGSSLPPITTSFPAPTHSQPSKVEFCCGRDQYLHSGDDADIVVRQSLEGYLAVQIDS